MQRHYSTVNQEEQRAGLARVVSLFGDAVNPQVDCMQTLWFSADRASLCRPLADATGRMQLYITNITNPCTDGYDLRIDILDLNSFQ